MILYSNRSVLGVIWKTLAFVIKLIYKILKFFSLQYALALIVIGAILYVTGAFVNKTVLIVYGLTLAVSVALAIYLSVRRLLGLSPKKEKKDKNPKSEKTDKSKADKTYKTEVASDKQPAETTYNDDEEGEDGNGESDSYASKTDVPLYFDVKGHPEYVMAEFSDRYELYKKKSGGGIEKVRVDYKAAR